MGNKLGHGEVGNEAAAGGSADSQRPPSGATSGSGRPPPAAASLSSTGSASGTSSVAVHNKKGKAGHQSGVEPGGGNHQVAQDCDTNDEQVPASLEPMNPIPVVNDGYFSHILCVRRRFSFSFMCCANIHHHGIFSIDFWIIHCWLQKFVFNFNALTQSHYIYVQQEPFLEEQPTIDCLFVSK